MQIEQEASLSPDQLVFLDRAIPDAMAYYRFLHLEPDQKLLDALKTANYKEVFLLDPLPFVQDYARTEDTAAQAELHGLLGEVYRSLGFPVVEVPVMPVSERIEVILANLESKTGA